VIGKERRAVLKVLQKKYNLKFNRSEISGSLGDMGTYLPLVTGLVVTSGMNLGHILFFSGAMHAASGLMFGLPMPVQPMKSIAAIAITEGLSENMIIAAGIGAGLILLILALTGTVDILRKYIPITIVRGLQLAIGLKLLMKGVSMVVETGSWLAVDSILVGLLCFTLLIMTTNKKKFPGALIVFSLGGILLLISKPGLISNLSLGWELPTIHIPNGAEFLAGFWQGTIPQIPLTILNSVIAVSVLSADLFPERPLDPRKVTISVALMNLISCPLGGMPMCHGSGGLAAQFRFGARTGGSVVLLGVAKMTIAVLFGGSLLILITEYPMSILGVLLLFSGLELALVSRDQTTKDKFLVVIITAGVCLAVNIAVGFVIGWAISFVIKKRGNNITSIIGMKPELKNISNRKAKYYG